MFAPGYNGGGDDAWINGMPASQWYAQNPKQKPKNYYTTELVNGQPKTTPHAVGPRVQPPAWTPQAQAQDDEQSAQWNTYMGSGGQSGFSPATPPMSPPQSNVPPTAGSASPVLPQAPRNPIFSNMTTQLSPTTMTALSGYGQSQRKRPYGGISSGLPFGRNLYGGF